MPRLPRVYIKGSAYYITCKGLPGQKVFNDNRDIEMYFSLMKKYKEELEVKIYSYCLLPDHLHMVVEVDEATPISSFMHKLNSAYTKYYNGRYERKGHLFRERFQTAFVEKKPEILRSLTAYIHLNPKRLQLVLQAESYPQSSYGLFLDYARHDDHGLGIKEEISALLAGMLGHDYRHFVAQWEKSDDYQGLHRQLHRKRMLGSEEFIERVKKEIMLQQEQPLTDKEETESGAALESGWGKKVALVIMIALAAGGVYLYASLRQPPMPVTDEKAGGQVAGPLVNLDRTEWHIVLRDSEQHMYNDIVYFQDGKFASGFLQAQAYPQANYSLVREGGMMIWETMQTAASGIASWRGEVDADGVMRGVMSLRQQTGEAKNFSFVSAKYQRR